MISGFRKEPVASITESGPTMEPFPANIKRNPLSGVRFGLQNEVFVSDFLCGCIVAGCFLLYLHYVLTHTLVYADDWQKQYLIANHIARFGEFPLVGDELSVLFGLHVTSPVYYYLFALVVWLHNSMLFAQVVWLSFSMLAIVCVYLIAKHLFSPVVGLLACALFGFSFAYAQQLGEAPNISAGQTLLYLSFLLLVRAYKSEDFALLLWAIAAYCIAGVIYLGSFGVSPVFAVVAASTLRKQRVGARCYLGALAVAGLTLFAAYLPVIIHAYHAHASLVERGLAYRFVHSPRTLLKDVLAHTIYATDALFLVVARGSKLPPLSGYAALARQLIFKGQALAPARVFPPREWASIIFVGFSTVSVITYFFVKTISRERKRHAAILACGIVAVLFSAALFHFYYHATWHYMAIQGLLCVLVAESVHAVFTRLRTPRSVELIFSFSLVWCCAGGFAGISMLTDRSPGICASPCAALKASASYADAAGAAIARETRLLRQALAEPQLHPQIKRYESGIELSNGVPYLWIYMENAFNESFVKLSDSVSYYEYEPVGDGRYLFVVCPHQARTQDCRDNFSTQYRQYVVVKDVIANDAYDIVLVRRL